MNISLIELNADMVFQVLLGNSCRNQTNDIFKIRFISDEAALKSKAALRPQSDSLVLFPKSKTVHVA